MQQNPMDEFAYDGGSTQQQNQQTHQQSVGGEQRYQLKFTGTGTEYFGISIVNWLLTAFTLSIYYPWAKARELQYLYGATTLNGSPFAFHGTGKEMFKGYLKAIALIVAIVGAAMLAGWITTPELTPTIAYLGMFAVMPFMVHGAYRYRMSRTSWRGIRFGYRGDRNEFIKKFYGWLGLTIVTFGLYGSWFVVNMRNYVLSHIRFGNLKFKYDADGGDFFVLNLKGYFLTIITLGIYAFWWQAESFAFYVDNLSLESADGQQGAGQKIRFRSTASGGDFFGLTVVNILIIIFTAGIGYAWVVARSLEFVFDHIEMVGNVDLDQLVQTEEHYTDATGEDFGDMLDIDLLF